MTMHFEGREESDARIASREDDNVTQIRPGRGDRTQNKVAARAEALGNGTEFDFDGKHYTLAPAEDWDLDVMENFSDGNMIAAAKALFEEKQWTEFRTDQDGNRIKRTNGDLAKFLEVAMKSLGVDPGESNS